MRVWAVAGMALVLAAGWAMAEPPKALVPLQGKWRIIQATESGKLIDPEVFRNFPVTFSDDQMEMVHEGDKMVKFTVFANPDRDPPEIDAQFPKDVEKGRIMRGVYRIDGERMAIAIGIDPKSTRPINFQALGGDKPTMTMVLERIK